MPDVSVVYDSGKDEYFYAKTISDFLDICELDSIIGSTKFDLAHTIILISDKKEEIEKKLKKILKDIHNNDDADRKTVVIATIDNELFSNEEKKKYKDWFKSLKVSVKFFKLKRILNPIQDKVQKILSEITYFLDKEQYEEQYQKHSRKYFIYGMPMIIFILFKTYIHNLIDDIVA